MPDDVPDDVAALLVAEWPAAGVEDSFGTPCLEVAAPQWREVLARLRNLGWTYFDWLSAVDEGDAGFAVVAHLWRLRPHQSVLVRTRVDRGTARLASVTSVFRGASWHERETHEMFGIDFEGHPSLTPLLLPDGFEGHPLRKEFVLAARAAKAWPGAKEPGESDSDVHSAARGRRKTLPPGVPDPAWGPRPPSAEATPDAGSAGGADV